MMKKEENTTYTETITPDNIGSESYYNLTRLCDLTSYANPISAIKALGEEWEVRKDHLGNIVGMA